MLAIKQACTTYGPQATCSPLISDRTGAGFLARDSSACTLQLCAKVHFHCFAHEVDKGLVDPQPGPGRSLV